MSKFIVIQDDVVVGSSDTVEGARALINELTERQRMKLMLNKRLLKKLFKKNLPLNISDFHIAVLMKEEST